ncbi:ribonuclease Z [Myroides injenensis]|uniref:ribonuclease Z n=1 Tax=Myroides injenensis TaxID=1183151 RepID=UPI00028886F9|nr:ribonuclease Z [Myroides injenensis]
MKVKEKGHTIILSSSEASVEAFLEKIIQQYESHFKKANLIIDLSNDTGVISEEDLNLFEEVAIEHIEQANKSFVIVVPNVDFNDFDGDLIVVPSLQEAHDLIEMDEIQRDLGF